MARWESSNSTVNIDLNISNIYLSGDYPNITMHFDSDFNYYCKDIKDARASSHRNGVNFETTLIDPNYTKEVKTEAVSFSITRGQESPRYGANYYNPRMGNARQKTWSIKANIPNGDFTGGGTTTVVSPSVGDPSNLKMSIGSITENSCVVTHSFTNNRNYWYVRLWDRNTKTYYNLNSNTSNGTTTITGLSPNTEYKFELWACGRDGVEYYGSSPTQTIKTLGKSSVGSAPGYTIGTNFPLVINGYSDSFTHDISFTIGGYSFSRTGLRRGTNIITPTSAETNAIYAQMWATITADMSISLTTYVNGTSIGTNYASGTVYVDQSVCAPKVNGLSYKDTNMASVALTGNNQYIIQNVSKLRVYDISATSMNHASISKYRLDVSGTSYENANSTIDTNTITADSTLSVKVFDSRGLQGTLNKKYTLFIPYQAPIVNEFTVTRRNNVDSTSSLNLKAVFSLITIDGVNKNAIEAVDYRYKETASSEWSVLFSVKPTITGNNITFNNVIGDFDTDKSYNFVITIVDKFKATTEETILIVGTPAVSIRENRVGINKVPAQGVALDADGTVCVSSTINNEFFGGVRKGDDNDLPITYNNPFTWADANVKTGLLMIKLGNFTSISNSMITVKFNVFNYGNSFTGMVSTYLYNSSPFQFYGPTYFTSNASLSAYFTIRTSDNTIWLCLGDYGTVWYYPTLTIESLTVAYRDWSDDKHTKGWQAQISTNLTGFYSTTQVLSNALLGRDGALFPTTNETPERVAVTGWDESWKFPSGLMILRYWNGFNISSFTAWGQVWSYSLPARAIPAGTFIQTPSFYMGAAGYGSGYDGNAWYGLNGGGSVSQFPSSEIIRPTNYATGYTFCQMAIGRWK